MYWVCEECGWENEYSDEVKYTDCQCCGSPATEKNITEATKALNRFHQEEERRKREEAIRLKVEKRQQAINGAMAGYIKVLRALPKVNIVATIIAILVIIGSFVAGDIPGEELWRRFSSNAQEITCFEQIGKSFETTNELFSNHFSSYFHMVGSNSESLIEIIPEAVPANASLLLDSVQSRNESMAANFETIGDSCSGYFSHLGTNSDMNADTISTQFTQTGANLGEVGDHISEDSSNLFRNVEFFWEKASTNITELFDKIFKR